MELYSSENSDSDGESSNTLEFSYSLLDSETLGHNVDVVSSAEAKEKNTLLLHHNNLTTIPINISKFCNLRKIDISNNRLSTLPEVLTRLPLRVLIAKNNILNDDFFTSKSLDLLSNTLEILNVSGNNLTTFPEQILQLTKLKYLYLGQNYISTIPSQINKLIRLEILSLGGNHLTDVPISVGQLYELQALILSNNQLESLPASVANLNKLRTLQLHKNKLRTLPTEIVALKYLSELSLRDNPLVVKFVSDMVYDPSTLQEMTARVIKLHDIPYGPEDLPKNLLDYLSSAHRCLNPSCKGVFFNTRVEHVKFVDFCGKYRLPLLQYLCSSKCINSTSSLGQAESSQHKQNSDMLRKVLLGNYGP